MSEDALLFVSSELFLSGQNCELSVFCVVSGRPRLLAVCVCYLLICWQACMGFLFSPQRQTQLGERSVG